MGKLRFCQLQPVKIQFIHLLFSEEPIRSRANWIITTEDREIDNVPRKVWTTGSMRFMERCYTFSNLAKNDFVIEATLRLNRPVPLHAYAMQRSSVDTVLEDTRRTLP